MAEMTRVERTAAAAKALFERAMVGNRAFYDDGINPTWEAPSPFDRRLWEEDATEALAAAFPDLPEIEGMRERVRVAEAERDEAFKRVGRQAEAAIVDHIEIERLRDLLREARAEDDHDWPDLNDEEDGYGRDPIKMARLLAGRDQFLVESDLFSAFAEWVRHPQQERPEYTGLGQTAAKPVDAALPIRAAESSAALARRAGVEEAAKIADERADYWLSAPPAPKLEAGVYDMLLRETKAIAEAIRALPLPAISPQEETKVLISLNEAVDLAGLGIRVERAEDGSYFMDTGWFSSPAAMAEARDAVRAECDRRRELERRSPTFSHKQLPPPPAQPTTGEG